MLALYQIGDLPLYNTIRGRDGKGVSIAFSHDWENPLTTFNDVEGVYSPLPLTRSISGVPDITFSGTVFATEWFTADMVMRHLKSMGGRINTPIIAFDIKNVENPDGTTGASDLLWLVNDCVINSVRDSYTYMDESDPWTFEVQNVEIDMTVGTNWRALPPWFWEYRPASSRLINPYSVGSISATPNPLFVLPETLDQLKEDSYMFRWPYISAQYDPSFWGVKYTDGRRGGKGADYSEFGPVEFYADPMIWSGTTQSFYAFTEIGESGTLTISVKKATGYFSDDVVTEVSTLDLGVVHSNLVAAGLGGLRSTDTIITGSVDPAPGFILRDGAPLGDVRPKWSYSGAWPGEVGRGYTEMLFQREDTPGKVAFLHDFGVK